MPSSNLTSNTAEILGNQAESLLNHSCSTISKDLLHLPGSDFVSDLFTPSNRGNQVLKNLESIYAHGRLGGTGYISILPVDQGIEHSAGKAAQRPDLNSRLLPMHHVRVRTCNSLRFAQAHCGTPP